MRWDDFRRSDNIEDDRDSGGGFGGGGVGIPVGRGGLGIGTVIVLGLIGWALGIDPEHPYRRRRDHQRRRLAISATLPAADAAHRDADRPQRPIRRRRARQYRRRLDRDLPRQRTGLPRGPFAPLPRRRGGRLRLRAGGDGAVLLPARQAHLSRHFVLPRDRAALSRLQRQSLRVRGSLCDCP